MREHDAPRPPIVDGVPETRLGDALRIVWWSQRGYRHGARHSRGAGRAFSTCLAIMWWLVIPLSIAVQACLLSRRAARYYLSPAHDAVLAIVATAEGWHVEDHVAAWPGTGRGKALRALVLPELRAAADAAGIPIYTTAANERLATEYSVELPGLVDVGRGYPRGRKMRREPQPAASRNVGR